MEQIEISEITVFKLEMLEMPCHAQLKVEQCEGGICGIFAHESTEALVAWKQQRILCDNDMNLYQKCVH